MTHDPPDLPLDARGAESLQKQGGFHEPVQRWFEATFAGPTRAQALGWPPILDNRSTLLLAPTGSGKTLSAFLTAIDRLMFTQPPDKKARCRVLYVSPLKALAVDVERNLRVPLAGIAAQGGALHVPTLRIRSGDTPASERAQMQRSPPDILITTPESLYLLLTSQAREILRSVETVIIDEIHALVPTKRGAHLCLSLERLQHLARVPLQRIGLSATQRPLDEVARLLGGGEASGKKWTPRPVTIVDAGAKKQLEVSIEVPVDDLSKMGEPRARTGSRAEREADEAASPRHSIWPSIHPRLVELIRSHRSTMIFVNSRRLAERLAGALNDLAGAEIALAHHGSVAREQRQATEERLKNGTLPAIVATSSLELGIDMGAVDLVVQIEAPPSIASGMQRIGRASHQVGGVPRGVIFPKHRGDLLCSAAAAAGMAAGQVEETFYPRNPLDVLAQQIVALASDGVWKVDEVYSLVRRAAPFADLPRASFEGVLDMLSGRYPSDEFAELRPRLTWDRVKGELRAREGAARVAVANAGTIPDRGLYGVFIASDGVQRRVGELDEEMVFESREGDVFVLGASSWRIDEITQDKVMVTPAPGEPGKMPFWHGDRPGRPLEFGQRVGKLSRELARATQAKAEKRLREEHGLDERAAKNLVQYLHDQANATGEVPSDETVIVERYRDDLGDFRVCVLTPFGARIHAPWTVAVARRLAETHALEARGSASGRAEAEGRSIGVVETMWTDDGMVFRIPETDAPPDAALFFPKAPRSSPPASARTPRARCCCRGDIRGGAARSGRSASGRAICCRSPRATDRFRFCSRPTASACATSSTCRASCRRSSAWRRRACASCRWRRARPRRSPRRCSSRTWRTSSTTATRRWPSGGRRRWWSIILGDAELRELLDADSIEAHERGQQRFTRPARGIDGLHDLLLQLGDLSEAELRPRFEGDPPLAQLETERRAFAVTLAGEKRWVAAEDAARVRDGLGVGMLQGETPLRGRGTQRRGDAPFHGVPDALLEPVKDPLADLVSRWARTHGPFHAEDLAARWGIAVTPVNEALERLRQRDRVLEGEFLPGGRGREWVDAEVLKSLKRRSLARLRKQVEPVEPAALARFVADWQGLARPRRGLDALLSVIEQLQGAPLVASSLEREILPARIQPLRPGDLDVLFAAGELIWRGLEPIGNRDGRIALYLTDHYRILAPPPGVAEGPLCQKLRIELRKRGATFFADLQTATGAFPADLLKALWDLVWSGEVTNDTLSPLRSLMRAPDREERRMHTGAPFRSRRIGPPGSEGRWSLLPDPSGTPTERAAALAQTLLARHGLVTRESARAEEIAGGFSAVYPVLKAMEESGRVRASAARSSRSRGPRSACAACAIRRRSRRRWCSPPPTPRTHGARPCRGRMRTAMRARRGPPARRWCSTTAASSAGSAAESRICTPSFPPTSRCARARCGRWRRRWRRWSTAGGAKRSSSPASTAKRSPAPLSPQGSARLVLHPVSKVT